jgi:transcription elongation factor GreA
MKAKILKKHVASGKDAKSVYLTAAGLKNLQEEFNDLVNNKRPGVAARIQKAREYGDLSENAEYAEAKDEQSFIEGRILELEQILSNASVIDESAKGDFVQIGSKVTLHLNGNDVEFTIVGAQEANPANKRISHESPLGQALIGKKIGSVVEVEAPVGRVTYRIVSVS